ncbi:MAG: thioredoxin family protein [Hyphomicrobiales bacterium]
MKQLVKNITFVAMMLIAVSAVAQSKVKVYDPSADAKKDIKEAVTLAKKENKNVLLKIGGNWCPWCIKFHKYIYDTPELKKMVNDNYVVVNVNYSKENKNLDVLAELGYPQRFGFPVFVILDQDGNRIHTQNSAYLESGKGYDMAKVKSFFKNWSPSALNPANYK